MKATVLGMILNCRQFVDKQGKTRYFVDFLGDCGEVFNVESDSPHQKDLSFVNYDIFISSGISKEGKRWTKIKLL